jgi:broad specificity phosphatase PhoE
MQIPQQNDACVYVVRHGRTVLNANNSFRGNANPPLDEVGLKQADTVADLFKDVPLSHIFCSDKQRATKTAEIISQAKGGPVHQSVSLRALNVGNFSGKPRNPESEAELQSYLDDPDCCIPGGESLNDFRARIRPCLQEAIDLYAECGVPPMLVAHSSVVHEIGNIATGDHKSVLVEPGGAIAVYVKNGKITAQPIFKPLKIAKGSGAKIIT